MIEPTSISASEQVEQTDTLYPGDNVEQTSPIKSTGYEVLKFADMAECFLFFNTNFSADGGNTLHRWQTELLEMFTRVKPTKLNPLKVCLTAANGSGKDSIIIAGFVIAFLLMKIQGRIICTSSSGVQLNAQTESAIRDLAEQVNKFFGCEYLRIRLRYITCRLTGSEIRLFATDEKGKAEGYHPITPTSEMAIIITEWKSVKDDITEALRRCTGYNYWLGVSTPGEPIGALYKAATKYTPINLNEIHTVDKPGSYVFRVTSYDCGHLSIQDIEDDKLELGEHSAFFRSKHLALFTSLGGQVIITSELVDKVLKNPPKYSMISWPDRVGIDLAAGGDENVLSFIRGNKSFKEIYFREVDTTICADRIDRELTANGIDKKHEHIYADDGGVGHGTIDQLVRKGWNIKRVLNQWAAINKRQFGNRGAENWYRCQRLFDECLIDISNLSDLTKKQLFTRRYKQQLTGAKIYLEGKKEAKANGRPSPDRADAFILALTGLTIDTFHKAKTSNTPAPNHKDGEEILRTNKDIVNYYEENKTYAEFNGIKPRIRNTGKRLFNSLKSAMRN